MSAVEKEGAALVTRPRLTNDQVLATLTAGPDATEGPDVEIAEGMIRVGFSRLLELLEQPENDNTLSRKFARQLYELRTLKRRFPLVFIGAVARPQCRHREPYITVAELADAIGQAVGAARRLLDGDKIPGARRKTPDVKGSPWLIPADAPARYLAQHEGRTNGTR